MYQRDPRSLPYDDQNTAYSSGHIPHQSAEYTTSSHQQEHGSNHYYGPPTHGVGGVHDENSPYFRSMTPSVAPTHRYPNSSRDPRYYNPQGFGGSSSSASASAYAAQNQQYPTHYLPTSDQRSAPHTHTPHPPQFIPTPSEIANSYSSYGHQIVPPHSPSTIPEDGYDYPAPPHMVPSSQGGHGHRPSRITTGRPRTVSAATSTSPTSASSPSGERFPCEKCGKTFSRSHDRKRHHETQHLPTPIFHVCPYCSKEFSRNDSLKRHLDNGCDEMPS